MKREGLDCSIGLSCRYCVSMRSLSPLDEGESGSAMHAQKAEQEEDTSPTCDQNY